MWSPFMDFIDVSFFEGREKYLDKSKYCYSCKHLTSTMCGAGGIAYGCRLLTPGLIIGEDAHWTDEIDKPVRCDKFDAHSIA